MKREKSTKQTTMKFKQNRRKYDDDDHDHDATSKKEPDEMNAKRNSTYNRNVDQISVLYHTSLWASRFEYTLTHTNNEAKKKNRIQQKNNEKITHNRNEHTTKAPNLNRMIFFICSSWFSLVLACDLYNAAVMAILVFDR